MPARGRQPRPRGRNQAHARDRFKRSESKSLHAGRSRELPRRHRAGLRVRPALTSAHQVIAAWFASPSVANGALRDEQVGLRVADQVLDDARRLRIRRLAAVGPEAVAQRRPAIRSENTTAGTPPASSKHSASLAMRPMASPLRRPHRPRCAPSRRPSAGFLPRQSAISVTAKMRACRGFSG